MIGDVVWKVVWYIANYFYKITLFDDVISQSSMYFDDLFLNVFSPTEYVPEIKIAKKT